MNAQLDETLAGLEKAFIAYSEALVTRRMAAAVGADPAGLRYLDGAIGELRHAYDEERMTFSLLARPLVGPQHTWAEINLDLDELLLGLRRQRLRAMAGAIVPKDILPIDITLSAHRERLLSRLTIESPEGGEKYVEATGGVPTGAEVYADQDPGR